jgi:hypothetical protein
VVYDKASDRLSISATLTEAVAKMLRDGLEPRLLQKRLRRSDSHSTTTLRQNYRLAGLSVQVTTPAAVIASL